MSDIRRLRTFMEFTRLGTIADVAEATSYSTSAVSQQLAQLEQSMGAPLVEPHGRKLRLTPAGHLLASLGPELLNQWEAARSSLATTTAEVGGTIKLAAFQTACIAVVPKLLSTLRELFPALDVHCVQAEPERAVPGLLAREFDVAIIEHYTGRPSAPHPDLVETRLCDDPMHIAVPRGASAATLSDLAEIPWVFEAPGSPVRSWAVDVCRRAGFEPYIAHETSDVIVQCALAAAGHAAAFVPALIPEGHRSGATLIPLPTREARSLAAVTRISAANDPAVRGVTAALRAQLGAFVGEEAPL